MEEAESKEQTPVCPAEPLVPNVGCVKNLNGGAAPATNSSHAE